MEEFFQDGDYRNASTGNCGRHCQPHRGARGRQGRRQRHASRDSVEPRTIVAREPGACPSPLARPPDALAPALALSLQARARTLGSLMKILRTVILLIISGCGLSFAGQQTAIQLCNTVSRSEAVVHLPQSVLIGVARALGFGLCILLPETGGIPAFHRRLGVVGGREILFGAYSFDPVVNGLLVCRP